MRVAVIGPGAIGAVVTAALERAGHAVVLCGRRPLDRIVVEQPDGGEHVIAATPVLADPAQAPGRLDWILLATKTTQNAAAAAWLRALAGPASVVAVLQNGVEHRENVEPLAGGAAVLPVIVWVGSETVADGRVVQRSGLRLSVPDDEHGSGLAGIFGAVAQVDRVADFTTEAWRKLCLNAVAGILPVVRRRGEVFRDERVAGLTRAYAAECVAVARAAGAQLGEEDAVSIAEGMIAMPPDSGTSILFDRLAGRPMEWDTRNGIIQRTGARHGVPTPVSDVLVPVLAALDTAP
jgi:2-dehydropantoate 2-reductase